MHLVKPRGRPNFYPHSAFPWLAAGAPVPLTLYETNTDCFGLEGFVDASVPDGPAVTFFDPLFALNKGQYKPGVEYRFTLGGVSLDLKLAAPEPVRISNPEISAEMREAERAATGSVSSNVGYVEVDTSPAKILLRAAEDAFDFYIFDGPVRAFGRSAAPLS